MFIDTTIYLHVDTMERFSRINRKSGLTIQQIVSRLLGFIADEEMMKPVVWARIRYQDRDRRGNWRRKHLLLTPAEYELLLDLKKVYKSSGSRIIAFALKKYLEELEAPSKKNTDNYRISSYVFSRFVIDGVVCFAQYWGIPRNLHAFSDLGIPVGNHVPFRSS